MIEPSRNTRSYRGLNFLVSASHPWKLANAVLPPTQMGGAAAEFGPRNR